LKIRLSLKRNYSDIIFEDLQLNSSTDFGALLIDGFGDGVWLSVSDLKSRRRKSGTYVKSFIKRFEKIKSYKQTFV